MNITFQLTKKQYRKLQPLFNQAIRNFEDGPPGMIIMQPKIYLDGHECMDVVAGFVQNDQAVKIVEAMGGE